MSLATLKKKSAAIQTPHCGRKGFSLNGALRPQGYIGQTSLSRTLPRSLSGPYGGLRGYGGNGNLNDLKGPGIVSGLQDFNDDTVIKPSVGNTLSMIHTKYLGLLTHGTQKPPCILDPTSPDYCGQLINETSGDHTSALAAKALQCTVETSRDSATAITVNDPFLLQITRPKYTNYNAIRNSCPSQKLEINTNGNNGNYFQSYEDYLNNYRSSCNTSKIIASQTCQVPLPSLTKPKKDIYS